MRCWRVRSSGNRARAALLALALGAAACVSLPERPPYPGPAFVAGDGTRLPLRAVPDGARPRAILVALHGFNDYGGFIEEAAHYFAAQGIATLAYDQRGFGANPGAGRWPGTAPLVDDFLGFLAQARRDHPGVPVYALGQSMGGAVIAVALARHPDARLEGAILVTPAVWSRDTMPWYQRFGIWLGAATMPGAGLGSSEFDIPSTDNAEASTRFAADPLTLKKTRFDTLSGLTDLMDEAQASVARIGVRTLFLYGLQDAMIPRPPMIALLERWPPQAAPAFRFALYPEGHHLLLADLQRELVWRDIASWILDPAARLPSGLERSRARALERLRDQGTPSIR